MKVLITTECDVVCYTNIQRRDLNTVGLINSHAIITKEKCQIKCLLSHLFAMRTLKLHPNSFERGKNILHVLSSIG